MPPTHHTYNEFHLGDNFLHLHFLRGLARQHPNHQFIHAAHPCHLDQMAEVVADLPNIGLVMLEDRDPASINCWKNADGFFQNHASGGQVLEFHLGWFAHLAAKMGLESPFAPWEVGDLLMDYPALQGPVRPEWKPGPREGRWDFLVVNSRPCSGQLMAYDRVEYFDPLIEELVARSYSVLVTQPTDVPGVDCTMTQKISLTGIGILSRWCDHHVMVSTGPSWPVLNKWNIPSPNVRILLLGTERINHAGLVNVSDLEGCRAVLRERGLL